ncbi:hypothetical protein NQ317_009612 [Molorchus minor]|uniref:Uncharacterized protein n=1 Tax=Molorchus minor TaxID=1323400 RepID=A0ABQ9JT18_9CUCU|nr:hypothetical protein NQ317_009612 [Molorchus minor]
MYYRYVILNISILPPEEVTLVQVHMEQLYQAKKKHLIKILSLNLGTCLPKNNNCSIDARQELAELVKRKAEIGG